jgi:ketosteroid isomerase-like protein
METTQDDPAEGNDNVRRGVSDGSQILKRPCNADNVHLFRQIIERGFNRGDLDVADEICATDFSEHQYGLPTELPGPEILKLEIRNSRASLDGFCLTIEDIVADEDKVWARMTARGTDRKSGRAVTAAVMDVCRFTRDGHMVEHWGVPDRFAALDQLGLIPTQPV